MKRTFIAFITASIAALLLFSGCQSEPASEFPGEDATYSEDVANLGVSNRFAGIVTSSGETKIEKDESRAIAKVKVSAGDTVKKGQVLFVYDSEQAQLNYDKANLELEQLNYSIQSYNDQKAVLEKEKASAGEGEQLSYTIQIQEIDTNIREAEYNIKAKEKEVAKLKDGLKNLKVKSPINGKVQSINAEGSMDSNGSELPYMVLMNTGLYRVKAYINETNAMELYEGAKVIVRSRKNDSTWTGTVTMVDFNSPASSQQGYMSEDITEVSSSSKYPFYVELDDDTGLLLGEHVYVEVDVEFSVPEPEDAEGEDGMEFADEAMPEGMEFADEAMPEDAEFAGEAMPEDMEFSDDSGMEGPDMNGPGANDMYEMESAVIDGP